MSNGENVGAAQAAPSLVELRERVRKATEQDYDLDADLVAHFISDNEARIHRESSLHMYHYSGSIDCALGLVEKVLPDWGIEIYRFAAGVMKESFWTCEISEPGSVHPGYEADATSAPLAILDALLSALIAQSTTESPVPQSEKGG